MPFLSLSRTSAEHGIYEAMRNGAVKNSEKDVLRGSFSIRRLMKVIKGMNYSTIRRGCYAPIQKLRISCEAGDEAKRAGAARIYRIFRPEESFAKRRAAAGCIRG